jgi:hypothetical protein
MSKYLDKAIKEMRNYGDMGLPDGENGGGMGSVSKNPVVNAYKMNNILRRRQQAEEEEMSMGGEDRESEMSMGDEMGMDAEDGDMEMDMDMGGMDDEGMDDEMGGEDTEEMKQFFQDNPSPSDEEVTQYAEERGIDMEQMRKEVYALIQSLLGDQDPVGDGEEDMGDEIEFSAPIDDENGVPAEKDMERGM